jgi:hypothetical protein
MSCNCSAKYDNKVPCCCSQGIPLVCTTTTCKDAQVCDKTVESDCVIYTGPNISCSGITTGMTVTEVMDVILEQLNLINCSYCWNVTNNGSISTTFDYVDVNGVTVTYPNSVPAGATVQVCGRSVDTTNVTPTQIGRCSVCVLTTTTTAPVGPIIPTARCTAGNGSFGNYYKMERTWQEPTYTYTLNSMLFDGVEYANGEILTINTATDLVTGTSLIDGLPYIMNINDWLNSITGVSTSGFVFYDDMHVIDKPDTNSTYYIEIDMVALGNSYTYYYSSNNGFEVNPGAGPNEQLGTYTCEPI